jgi:hypothetical protein
MEVDHEELEVLQLITASEDSASEQETKVCPL